MNPRLALLLALASALLVWHFAARPLPPPGVAAPEEPSQGAASGPGWPVGPGGYYAAPLAGYHVHARVLGVTHYHFDPCAPVAPLDAVLGWGRMSDSAVYRRLGISQHGRYYFYEWGAGGPPVPAREIATHSANTHLIPADAAVGRALSALRTGDVVWLDGALVEVNGPGGFRWRSSLTREDTGGGACELMRVTGVAVEP